LASSGAQVLFVTPDRGTLHELGPTNSSVVHRDLYQAGVTFFTNLDLVEIEKEADQYHVTLQNVLTKQNLRKTVDHVVVENGTRANLEIYEALKPQSRNNGEIDINALADGILKLPDHNSPVGNNSKGSFDLVRIGDAVSSRNIHAALYDALRIGSNY
ncbi:MAG: N-methylproline demethylase, partial [Proteobacteria bacterium]|nr:N-methylproline demethylase [Pseudomonadota bacterium]